MLFSNAGSAQAMSPPLPKSSTSGLSRPPCMVVVCFCEATGCANNRGVAVLISDGNTCRSDRRSGEATPDHLVELAAATQLLFPSLQLGSASGSSSPGADCSFSKEIGAPRSPPKEDIQPRHRCQRRCPRISKIRPLVKGANHPRWGWR